MAPTAPTSGWMASAAIAVSQSGSTTRISSLTKARSREVASATAALFRAEKLNGASMRITRTRGVRDSRCISRSAGWVWLPLSTMQRSRAG